jgi:hypothetical protein
MTCKKIEPPDRRFGLTINVLQLYTSQERFPEVMV